MNRTASVYDPAFSDTASVRSSIADPVKSMWRHTQWTNLSYQAKALGLPPGTYFDPQTMLLDKKTNATLWKLLGRLYDTLGPERARFAHPVMLEGGAVQWHNYSDDCRGAVAEIVE